jgi:alpha-tubulin suppressor-like RCC1 family protein
VAGGSEFTCAAFNDGTARCWGSNDSGQLGNGTTTDSAVPAEVSGGAGFY